MGLVETVKAVAIEELDRVAKVIEGELKAECPKKTGRTAGSISTQAVDEHTRRIGSSLLTMYYSAYGNGGSGRVITSTRAVDRRGNPPGKLKLSDGSYRTMVHGYKPPRNFVRDVANRHR